MNEDQPEPTFREASAPLVAMWGNFIWWLMDRLKFPIMALTRLVEGIDERFKG